MKNIKKLAHKLNANDCTLDENAQTLVAEAEKLHLPPLGKEMAKQILRTLLY